MTDKALKLLLSTLLMLVPSLSQAKQVIALGNSQRVNGFNEHLEGHPQKVSLIEALITKSIATGDQHLLDKHKLAVKGLLFEDLAPSIFLFKELADLKSSLLFSKIGKKIISESHYRLSNLEPLKLNFWVKQAFLFDKNYTPSSQIFSPKVIKSFEAQRAELKNYYYLFSTKKLSGKNTHLFINGSLTNGSLYLHPSASYKIRAFKSGFKEFSLSTLGKDLPKTKKMKMIPLNLGTCKKPRFKIYQGIQIDEIFFSKNCVRKKTELRLATKRTPLILNALSQKNNSLGPLRPPKKKSFFKRKSTWYATTGVLVAAAIVIYINNEQKKDVRIEPVHL